MRGNLRPALILAGIMVLLTVVSYVGVNAVSGVNPPVTVVVSQSMQHSHESEIGVIDTGDMILVRSPDKVNIVSYVEGYESDYSSFGTYGNVIVYNRVNDDPVIHRAILWLEYNGDDGTWSAPTLENYKDENGYKWFTSNEEGERAYDWAHLSGKLTLILDYKGTDYDGGGPSIDLSTLSKSSGYLTMGDNNETNKGFDQKYAISQYHLVSKEDIRSVAWAEFPWVGAIRLFFKGNTEVLNEWAPNAIPNLAIQAFVILMIIVAFGFSMDVIVLYRIRKKLKKLEKQS